MLMGELTVDVQFILDLLTKAEEDPWASAEKIEDEPDYIKGLFRKLTPIAPPDIAKTEAITVVQARERIANAMRDYFAEPTPAHMLLIKALPGVGKTTAAVAQAERLAEQGKRVLYVGPRHDFWHDVMAIAKHPEWWYEWLPRQEGDPDRDEPETCPHATAIATWMDRGYRGIEFCKKICGWDVINDGCKYHAQKRRSEPIIFGQHQHIMLGHPLKFNAVIGDESPLQAFCHEWSIPAQWVAPPGLDPTDSLSEIIHIMSQLCAAQARTDGEALLQLLGGAQHVIEACESWTLPASAEFLAPDIYHASQVEGVPYAHLGQLVPLLLREARAALKGEPYPHRILLRRGQLKLLLRRPVNAELPAHIAWLDATANARLYEACFRVRAKIVDAQPKLQGSIYQVVDRANGKASLITQNGELTSKVAQLEQQVARIIEKNGYKRPAIITFQGVLEQTQTFRNLAHTHFYAARGTNALENVDALIVAGVPQPPLASLEYAAKMLFFERMNAFARTFFSKQAPFNYVDAKDGQGRQYPVSGFWNDPDLDAVLWSMREAEVIQAAHRARPVNKPVDIWLLLNLPVWELPPTRLLEIRDLFQAPEGVDAYIWPDVLKVAELCYQHHGAVTTTDLVNKLGVSRPTAAKYLEALAKEEGWSLELAASKKGGRPTKCARRNTQFNT